MTENLMSSYHELVSSYQAIDNFRSQLLGRLPLATGAGIFLLYSTQGPLPQETRAFLPAIGLFGFVITLGLFAYEIYGIMKCHHLILAGRMLEGMLGIDGQFLHRPGSVLGFISEPLAAALIYPAVLAAWTYLATAVPDSQTAPMQVATLVFLVFLMLAIAYIVWLKKDGARGDVALLNQAILNAEEQGNKQVLARYLHSDFVMLRADGTRQDLSEFLNAIMMNKDRGRQATQGNVQMVGNYALYTGIVKTTQNSDGTPNPGCFWNTRLFVKEDGQWCCLNWQVMRIL